VRNREKVKSHTLAAQQQKYSTSSGKTTGGLGEIGEEVDTRRDC
jgi:hypothetical protein